MGRLSTTECTYLPTSQTKSHEIVHLNNRESISMGRLSYPEERESRPKGEHIYCPRRDLHQSMP